MKSLPIYLLLLLTITIISCKRELPFPDIDQAPLLVVNSLFSPDEVLEVHVSESCHIADTNCILNFIPDAEVLLQDESGNLLTTLSHSAAGIYSASNFSLNPNTTYQIQVNKTGLKSVNAKSQIPKAISVTYLDKEEKLFDGNFVWAFNVEIEDDPNEKNFYLLEGYFEILNGEHDFGGFEEENGIIQPHFAHYTNDLNSENKAIYAGLDVQSNAIPLRKVFLPDENFNGQTYTTEVAIKDWDIYDLPEAEFVAHIFVKSVTEEMYDYEKSLEISRLLKNNIFAEPEIIYSNITEGLGIFAGYTQQEFMIDLPTTEFLFPSEIDIEHENGCTTAPCTVSFTTNGGANLEYNWDFGDNNSSTEANPEHTYQAAGTYPVNLNISLGSGGSASWDFEVIIN